MKNSSCSAATVDGSAPLPFVISTEAYPDFLLREASNDHPSPAEEGSLHRRSHGLGPTKGDESTLCSATTLPWKHRPPLCHLDRSVPGFPTSRSWRGPRMRFSLRKPHDVDQRHRSRQEIRGSAVERSLCGCSFLGMFFDRLPRRGFCLRPFYSSRRSNKGSAPSARNAGTNVASSPSRIMTPTTPARTSGSPDAP